MVKRFGYSTKTYLKNADTTPDNFLQLAIRSRIKFFYRPASIKEDANLAADKLQWVKSGQNLTVKIQLLSTLR